MPAEPAAGTAGGSVTAGDTRWVLAACLLAELAENTAVHLDLDGHPVCLTRSLGTVHALLEKCSHGQVVLSDGDVEDG